MIHVYSDSFGETHGDGTWPAKLEFIREEEVKINGSGGTGPNWSLRKLINDLETSKIKNKDSVIVLLSDQKRMEFPWLENDWWKMRAPSVCNGGVGVFQGNVSCSDVSVFAACHFLSSPFWRMPLPFLPPFWLTP